MTLSAYVDRSSNTHNATQSYKKKLSNHCHSQTNPQKKSLRKGTKLLYKKQLLLRDTLGWGGKGPKHYETNSLIVLPDSSMYFLARPSELSATQL